MTEFTFTQAAMAVVASEAKTASDAGFTLVGACAVAFIAGHIEKADLKTLKSDMADNTVGQFHKKSHANDIVNAGLRLARRIWKNKPLLATIAAEPTPEAATLIVAAEARTIADEHGSASLRSLFEALKPDAKKRTQADAFTRAKAALAKLSEFDGLTLASLVELESEIAKLRAQLAAQQAQEQVDDMPDIVTGADAETKAA